MIMVNYLVRHIDISVLQMIRQTIPTPLVHIFNILRHHSGPPSDEIPQNPARFYREIQVPRVFRVLSL